MGLCDVIGIPNTLASNPSALERKAAQTSETDPTTPAIVAGQRIRGVGEAGRSGTPEPPGV
jgi:hypothetical protein